MEKGGKMAFGDGNSLPKCKKNMQTGNFFSRKNDVFNVDRGCYNKKYYGDS